MEEWEVTTDATLEWFIVSECRLRNKGGNIVELTEQQQSVIDSTSRRIVVLSCAGSGKTTVIALRIASLWKKGAKPEEFLALTFSNKAAQEMKKRIYKEDPNLGAKVCVKTFHAFGLEIVKRFNTALGFSGPVTCPECGQSVSDHADACPKCGYPVGAMIEKQKKDVDDLCNLGCKYLNGDGVSRDYKKAAEYFRNAAEQGHAIAQYNLGLMYELGDGVPQSYCLVLFSGYSDGFLVHGIPPDR